MTKIHIVSKSGIYTHKGTNTERNRKAAIVCLHHTQTRRSCMDMLKYQQNTRCVPRNCLIGSSPTKTVPDIHPGLDLINSLLIFISIETHNLSVLRAHQRVMAYLHSIHIVQKATVLKLSIYTYNADFNLQIYENNV